MKKEYEKPEIQCYKMDIDSIMNELSVPKNPGDSTDEQCSKKFDFENQFEDDDDSGMK